ncbi:thioredoxin family protein [Thioalkalivibrio sp. HK1]|uniref:thioredoxin family protein n=1 Tax=Thioalkalivibrio sp. HK1 TaxID=1469245 RepID=UPI000471DFEA|nr:thioredoxin family protein [Thioalkalivibrio sp. HK1]
MNTDIAHDSTASRSSPSPRRSPGSCGFGRGLISLVAGLVYALSTTSLAVEIRDPYQYFFQDTFGDFAEEIEIAREEGKKGIVIFFEMDECPFCARMRETVLNRASVQDYYREHFRIFMVDIEGDTEVVDFSGDIMLAKDFAFKLHKVRATPVIAFFDLEGTRTVRFTGAVRNPDEFLLLGHFAVEGYYEKTNFTRFKRAWKAEQSAQQ